MKDEGSTDTYTLRAVGAPVINIDGKLFAELMDPGLGKNVWEIHAQPQHGKNIFTYVSPRTGRPSMSENEGTDGVNYRIVSSDDKSIGWVVPNEEPDTQLEVRPLISTKSLPPQFPPNELFEIIPILEE